MPQGRRTNSRNSLSSEKEDNKSNSNAAGSRQSGSVQKEFTVKKQNSSTSLKILGQEGEVTEESLWNGAKSDRSTPVSSRSQTGIRPGSTSSRRTPTPSKQISLQSVKRKEEKEEPLEPINWSEIDQPFMVENDRIPSLSLSDDESDLTLGSRPLSAEEHLALIEQRTKEMTSALSSVRMDEHETSLALQLESIETAREEREQKEREELARNMGKTENKLTVEDGQFTYRNEHFRDLSHRDPKDKIDKSFIMGGKSTSQDEMLKVGKSKVDKQIMDTTPDTAVAAAFRAELEQAGASKSDKKDEVTEKDESSSSDDDSDNNDDDDDDLIGEKGKAPNALLMEFLSCMMEEDYENAEKLCKMILIYEPDNPEALSFFPLIQEKRRQEEEEEDDEDDSSDESDDSGEEEDSDDDDDDDDDDNSDNDDEEEDNNSSGSDNEPIPHTDSGIASANSD